MLEQYTISDVLTWLDEKTLVLNTNFQRRNVWPQAAKTFLIDTVLRDRPMPKIYLRTRTDVSTRRSFREVVDGQQRLRAIYEFANGEFALDSRAQEFEGKRYTDLSEDDQRNYLSYQVGVEQLLNADDEDVLDVFHRLNSYGLPLNPQELRHGSYQGAFRWAVLDASKRWSVLWERYQVVGLRARVRMVDDELMAQMFGVVLEGVVDGGQPTITRLYKTYDGGLPLETLDKVDGVVAYILDHFSDVLETGLSRSPHFLMWFAAVTHGLFGIPNGDMGDNMPSEDPRVLTDLPAAKANLGRLSEVLELSEEEIPVRFVPFKLASAGTTQRIRSRRIRFPLLWRALLPETL